MLPLRRDHSYGAERIGGKALGLQRLIQAGVPVPPAFVIPAEVAASVCGSAEAVTPQAIRALVVPPAIAERWVSVARQLGPRVAVRSSGVQEDGQARSFAGIHLTEVGVPPEDVPSAVLRVWASAFEAAAKAYHSPGAGGMAVVLQAQVEPVVSGVLFTVNPKNGSWREMTTEAVWGLGEPLVSGQIVPHGYRVRRPHRLPEVTQRVWERVRLREMQADLPDLATQMVLDARGQVITEPVPPERRAARTLSPKALVGLCRLGLKIERRLGGPQDIEWARDEAGRFWVLQSRPITRTGTPRTDRTAVWTRRFIGERWPEPATPMGWSIMGPIFEWFIGYPEVQRRFLGGGPPVKLVDGRPYLNTTVFRHLAFKLPGAPVPGFMEELLPPEETHEWRMRRAVSPDLPVYVALLLTSMRERRWERFAFNPLTNATAWEAWRERLDRQRLAWEVPATSASDWLARLDEQHEWIREYTGIHLCSLLFANLFYPLLDAAISAEFPEERLTLLDALGTCPDGNRTLEVNAALYQLAHAASEADLKRLARGHKARGRFKGRLDAFVEAYGHRCEASWEICAPRWRHTPSALEPLLRVQRANPTDPAARAQAQREASQHALERITERLNWQQRAWWLPLITWTRRYLLLRENQRFWFDHLLEATQRSLHGAAEGLVGRGGLRTADDVAFLTVSELKASVQQEGVSPDLLDAIQRRQSAWRQQASGPQPPVFLRGDDGPKPTAGRRLSGTGISGGRASGRVRVVRRLSEAEGFQPGEVLVARALDPGWTPLLANAAGVILELGGLLSHGAVVAREYGVPMVVHIDGATERLTTGQSVTLDGQQGRIWIRSTHGE